MFCENCGQELSSNTKFCPGCGTAIEEDKLEIQSAISENGVDNSSSLESAENNVTDIDSSAENKSDEAEKDTVNTQPAESPSEPKKVDNEAIGNTNESNQSEAAKSENSVTDNIKEVLLPQKGKNGKVRFKDLSKKQKIIRIAIGAGLLLIALILFISDGLSGAKKAENPSSNKTYESYLADENSNNSTNIKNIGQGKKAFKCTLEEYITDHNTLYLELLRDYFGTDYSDENKELEGDIADITTSNAIISKTNDDGVFRDSTVYLWSDSADIYAHGVFVDEKTKLVLGARVCFDPDWAKETESEKKEDQLVVAFSPLGDSYEKLLKEAENGYAYDDKTNTAVYYYNDPEDNTEIWTYAAVSEEDFDKIIKIYENGIDDSIESPRKETHDKTIITNEQALVALYATSIFEGTSYETAVQYGSFSDVSIGEALDQGFEDPSIEYEKGEDCVYITVSGMFYINGSTRTYKSITYKVDEDLSVSVYKDSGNVEQNLIEWAGYLGSN